MKTPTTFKLPIPYGRHTVTEADIEAVVRVLRSDRLTQGPAVLEFEQKTARYCGAKHAVAVCNATAGLSLAAYVAGVGPGKSAWTSPISFVASSNCVLYCGGRPEFVDIDPATANLSVPALAEKLARAKKTGSLPHAVIPVHMAGVPCDLAGIHALAQTYGFRVIEDASHAIGADYQTTRIGSGAYSDFTVFSFHAVKVITSGEGGMILTNDSAAYERLLELRTHGITRDPARMGQPCPGPWYYEQLDLGFNFRMTDFQAALGASQLDRLEQLVSERRRLVARYDKLLGGLPLQLPESPVGCRPAWHIYVVRLKTERLRRRRQEIFAGLRDAGIEATLHYIPIFNHPFYRRREYRAADFPQAVAYSDEALTLPLYPGLSEDAQDYVVNQLKGLIQEGSRR